MYIKINICTYKTFKLAKRTMFLTKNYFREISILLYCKCIRKSGNWFENRQFQFAMICVLSVLKRYIAKSIKEKVFLAISSRAFLWIKGKGKLKAIMKHRKLILLDRYLSQQKKKFAILVNNSGFAQLSKGQSFSNKVL